MSILETISIESAQQKIANQAMIVLDIRDITAYQQGHIPHAKHLTQQTIDNFLQTTDKTQPIIVYCYHGISSQSAAKYLSDVGFNEVYSMTGGFAAWLQAYPNNITLHE